jgi:hypothetical protein
MIYVCRCSDNEIKILHIDLFYVLDVVNRNKQYNVKIIDIDELNELKKKQISIVEVKTLDELIDCNVVNTIKNDMLYATDSFKKDTLRSLLCIYNQTSYNNIIDAIEEYIKYLRNSMKLIEINDNKYKEYLCKIEILSAYL